MASSKFSTSMRPVRLVTEVKPWLPSPSQKKSRTRIARTSSRSPPSPLGRRRMGAPVGLTARGISVKSRSSLGEESQRGSAKRGLKQINAYSDGCASASETSPRSRTGVPPRSSRDLHNNAKLSAIAGETRMAGPQRGNNRFTEEPVPAVSRTRAIPPPAITSSRTPVAPRPRRAVSSGKAGPAPPAGIGSQDDPSSKVPRRQDRPGDSTEGDALADDDEPRETGAWGQELERRSHRGGRCTSSTRPSRRASRPVAGDSRPSTRASPRPAVAASGHSCATSSTSHCCWRFSRSTSRGPPLPGADLSGPGDPGAAGLAGALPGPVPLEEAAVRRRLDRRPLLDRGRLGYGRRAGDGHAPDRGLLPAHPLARAGGDSPRSATVMALARPESAPPASPTVWPIVASMFMFRIIIYLYELKHAKKPSRWSTRSAISSCCRITASRSSRWSTTGRCSAGYFADDIHATQRAGCR